MTAGLLAWLAAGISLLVGGSIGQASSAWSDLEKVLNNCFWGAGNKYAFWPVDERPTILKQLQDAREMSDTIKNAFLIENQEFLNLFIQPQLKIHREYRKTTYRFTLPAFQMGVSEIYGLFVKENEIYYLGAQVITITINHRQYTRDTFRDATFEAARKQAKLILNGNTATLGCVPQ
ncbi:hypothetical protein CKY10_15725 [Photorhabdus sp. HUG-39]|uniref:Uncharacterized protein n=1 Tax=Photorhabdus kayaii TaxID=230088 RepID=A0ABX0B5Z2_9GAMM|nr:MULTISPECIES: hypothetical protein [Photorhabdus]MCC8375855.1 hypothetical protein [Photorhabdus bodei]NDL13189.1 hypothetical protein [Photorhabdus kayaii]NDL26983.1 hypothetical protein [Photorhabdus kayaii]RAX08384.1 hypothetical protein CKY10_15725 [Photorhabdus sp. HUG-39]